jgi:O-antigen ligase
MRSQVSPSGVAFAVTGALSAVVAGAAVVVAPLLTLGTAAVALLVAQPEIVLLAAAVGLEEQTVSGDSLSQGPALLELTRPFFTGSVGGLRACTLVALFAVAVVVLRQRTGRFDRVGLALCLGLALWGAVLAATQGNDPYASLTSATTWLVLGLAIMLGSALAREPRRLALAGRVLLGVLVAKVLLGALIAATGGAAVEVGSGLTVVYYDSAATVVAVSAVLTALFARMGRGSRLALLVVGLLLVGESLRRSVLLGAVVAAVLAVAAVRRFRIAGRAVLVAGAVLAALLIASPSFASALGSYVSSGIETVRGDAQESSTQGHVTDLQIGLDLAQTSPLTGVGVRSVQVEGLAAQSSSRLYVHDEWLQSWLLYGLPGLLVVSALVLLMLVRAVRYLRREAGRLEPVQTGAAFVLLSTPLSLLAFPQLSTTFRWPLLVGFALGIVLPQRRRSDPEEQDAGTVAEGAPLDRADDVPAGLPA